jgi:hypothetical protein
MDELCGRVLEHLRRRLSESNFIDRHHPDYRSTSLGFGMGVAQPFAFWKGRAARSDSE